jgi:ankyrin repeat protein
MVVLEIVRICFFFSLYLNRFFSVDINAVDKHGRNALHYAIDFGNQHLVELFLSNENCDPNYKDRDQMTPLHLAIKRNSPQIVQLLLSDQHEQQADPNIPNRYGQTPLHLAASVGYIDIVRLLLLSNLKEPCDPTMLDSQQLTAYALAKVNHQESCAKLIEEYQEKRYRPELQRQTTASINDQSIKATSSISLIPAANLQRDQDETSDNSSSISTTKPSKSSPRRIKRPSDQWSDENSESKQASHGINNLFQHNPIQPDEIKENSVLNTLFNNNPLQRNSKKKISTCKF